MREDLRKESGYTFGAGHTDANAKALVAVCNATAWSPAVEAHLRTLDAYPGDPAQPVRSACVHAAKKRAEKLRRGAAETPMDATMDSSMDFSMDSLVETSMVTTNGPKRQRTASSPFEGKQSTELTQLAPGLEATHLTTFGNLSPERRTLLVSALLAAPKKDAENLATFFFSFPDQHDAWFAQLGQTTDAQSAAGRIKAWRDFHNKEIDKNATDDMRRRNEELRKIGREVEDMVTALQNTPDQELQMHFIGDDYECEVVEDANAQLKDLKVRGFKDSQPYRNLESAIFQAKERAFKSWNTTVEVPKAKPWIQRLKHAPDSIEWTPHTIKELWDLKAGFDALGELALLPMPVGKPTEVAYRRVEHGGCNGVPRYEVKCPHGVKCTLRMADGVDRQLWVPYHTYTSMQGDNGKALHALWDAGELISTECEDPPWPAARQQRPILHPRPHGVRCVPLMPCFDLLFTSDLPSLAGHFF